MFSLEHAVQVFGATVRRFPLGVLAAMVATACGVVAVGRETDSMAMVEVVGIVAVVVMVWGVTATLAVEDRGARWMYGVSAVVVVLGVLYYMTLPRIADDFLTIHGMRTGLIIFAGLLLLCAAPFLWRRDDRVLWFFVMELSARFAFAFIAAATLYAGIAAAMASVNYLFGVDMEWEWYVRVWIVIAGFVAPMVFMAGIPRAHAMTDVQTRVVPRVVRVFAQYVLVPLLTLYTVILYAYAVKILVTRTWPQGGVGYMVLIFASVGLVTMLVLAADRETRRWVMRLSRVYFIIVLPTLMLLGGAIYVRIADYGWTPDRYSVVVLGLWFAGVAVYFLARQQADLRVPFVTLAVVMLLSIYGPWSMFATSVRSQVAHLAALVDMEGIRVNGVIAAAPHVRELSWGRFNAIHSRVQLLSDMDATSQIMPWFAADNQPLDVVRENQWQRITNIIDAMDIKEDSYRGDPTTSSTLYYNYSTEKTNNDAVDVGGYAYYVPYMSTYERAQESDTVTVDGTAYTIVLSDAQTVQLVRVVAQQRVVVATFDMAPLVTQMIAEYTSTHTMPHTMDPVVLQDTDGHRTFSCPIDSLTLDDIHTAPRVTTLLMHCLVR